MISVEEAINKLIKNIGTTSVKIVSLEESYGHFLAADIISPVSFPMFNQSAMDGYAFKFSDANKKLIVKDVIPAGDTRSVTVNSGETVRIFTGSKVPSDCDTVVMQELTRVDGNLLSINDSKLKLGGNIRKKGNQITKGDIALKKGTKITPAAIGFLATLGIEKISVFELPKVSIIVTGSELVELGNKLKEGQVYESNSHTLVSALKREGIIPKVLKVSDDLEATTNIVKTQLQSSDVLIISGGISVGDYDFVKEALLKNGVDELFYKVKQKPGKPLFFGKNKESYVFALPGNPAAALNCFYVYVRSAINLIQGASQPFLTKINLPISNELIKKEGRAQFFKAVIIDGKVHLLEGQDSDALQSFAYANCLVYVPSKKEKIEKNEQVEVFLLPTN